MAGVTIGLSKLHYAKLTVDSATELTYDTVKKLAKAVDAKADPKAEKAELYADNQLVEIEESFSSLDVEFGIDQLADDVAQDLFGFEKDEDGVTYCSIKDKTSYIAVGYEIALSGGHRKMTWLLKGKPELVGEEAKTKGDKVDFQTGKLKIKFIPTEHNGRYKASVSTLDETIKPEVFDNWFKTVRTKKPVTTP